MTTVKQQVIQRKFPTPVQFVIACPKFWQGAQTMTARPDPTSAQKSHVIKWHYDTLFLCYRSWAQTEGIDLRFTGKDWTFLVEPHKILGIYPHPLNKERICIDKRKFKGFVIESPTLVQNVKTFLTKVGQSDGSEFEIPKTSFLIDNSIREQEF
jgi:hypothetical protein